MANRKLKVELELETARAKAQAKSLAETAGGGSSSSAGGARLGAALDKAAKSAEKTASSFDGMNGKAAQLTRGFAGIAVGMATSYASNYVTNPNAKAGLEYTGSAVTGAIGGAMMAGPIGAAIGGLAGVLKTYMEKEGEKSAMSKDFETGEAVYAATYRDNQKFKELSSTKEGTDIAGNLAKVKEMLDNYAKSAATFVEKIRAEMKKANPDKELIAKLQRNLNYSRSQIARYENLQDTLESVIDKDETKNDRESFSALDSLTKVGGYFYGTGPKAEAEATPAAASRSRIPAFSGFSVAATPTQDISFGDAAPATDVADEAAQNVREDQLSTLRDILEELKKQEGTTWQ